MTTLRNLKVGDSVFVVQQQSRHITTERVSTKVITKVGRKYAYFNEYNDDDGGRFLRETGESVHITDNSMRANGWGFDVYLSEAEYRTHQHNVISRRHLEQRLLRHGGLVKLPPEVVSKFHEILDAEEVD